MDLLSASPYWPIKDGLPASYPSLNADLRCEVAIIGGGITGALIAWHLAEAGFDPVLLDRRDVAHGSTAGSTALLQYEIDIPLHELADRLGWDRAATAYRDCLQAIHDLRTLVQRLHIDCGFEDKGSLLLAHQPSHVARLRREFAARQQAGFNVSWLSQAQLARSSSLRQHGAILSAPGEAAQTDAYALAHGLLAAAVKKGARIFDRVAVTRRQHDARGVTLHTQDGATVRARHLIVAAGYEADQFLPRPVTTLHSTFALCSEPVTDFTGWPAGLPVIWDTADPYIYLRTTPDRRVIIGGYDEPFRDAQKRDALLPAKCRALVRHFRQLFPAIAFEPAYAWAGTFGKTADGLPFIGPHPGVPRTWFALGYGGNGITYSLIAAQLIRDHLLGRPVRAALELYGFERTPEARPGRTAK